jgi:hypothetical protein
MKTTVPVLGLLALVSLTAGAASPNQPSAVNASSQDSTKAYVTITIATPSQPESNELAGGSVVTVTKKIMPAAGVRFDGGEDLKLGDTLPPGSALPDGGSLPTTGTPGQTYAVDICVPRRSTTEYTFKWVPVPEPGHWEVVKVQNTQVASTTCS